MLVEESLSANSIAITILLKKSLAKSTDLEIEILSVSIVEQSIREVRVAGSMLPKL